MTIKVRRAHIRRDEGRSCAGEGFYGLVIQYGSWTKSTFPRICCAFASAAKASTCDDELLPRRKSSSRQNAPEWPCGGEAVCLMRKNSESAVNFSNCRRTGHRTRQSLRMTNRGSAVEKITRLYRPADRGQLDQAQSRFLQNRSDMRLNFDPRLEFFSDAIRRATACRISSASCRPT